MNTKFATALVFDQDQTSAKSMAGVVKDLFHKVYTQSDLKLLLPDLVDTKPGVVFVNLTIAQRTENLELSEHIARTEPAPLIFGYNDSHEPELLTHALESGIVDLFMRPFDEAIIASKINKYIQQERTLKHDLSYTQLAPPLPARVRFPVKITGVDENGVTLETEHYLSKGLTLRLPEALSRELAGEEKAEFMITRTWGGDTWNRFFSYAELRNTDDNKTAALRRFITEKNH